MFKLSNVRFVTIEGRSIYINPFYVPAILPYDDCHSVIKIKGARQQIVKGTPDDIYNAFFTTLNGGIFDDPNA